jgi:hypothetical protein
MSAVGKTKINVEVGYATLYMPTSEAVLKYPSINVFAHAMMKTKKAENIRGIEYDNNSPLYCLALIFNVNRGKTFFSSIKTERIKTTNAEKR